MYASDLGNNEIINLIWLYSQYTNQIVNANQQSKYNDTAFILASKNGYLSTIQLLTSLFDINIDIQGHHKRTAIIQAAYYYHYHLVEYLTSIGANLYLKDNTNRTVMNFDRAGQLFAAIERGSRILAKNRQLRHKSPNINPIVTTSNMILKQQDVLLSGSIYARKTLDHILIEHKEQEEVLNHQKVVSLEQEAEQSSFKEISCFKANQSNDEIDTTSSVLTHLMEVNDILIPPSPLPSPSKQQEQNQPQSQSQSQQQQKKMK